MSSFNSAQLFLFLTEVAKYDSKLTNGEHNHLVIMRFPQFEEIFSLTVRGEERSIAMMPTIALSTDLAPSLYMTYSDHDERKELSAIDSPILGVSIPVSTDNYENFQMEEIFEHEYGTFLSAVDKDQNNKVIEDIKGYIQNMVELLIEPLSNVTTRYLTLNRMVADYVPFIRVITDRARCKLKGYENSQVNINMVWEGKEWMTQLQNDYHPLWNLMLCRADFGIHVPQSLQKKKFQVNLQDSTNEEFWSNTLNIDLSEQAKHFISQLVLLKEEHEFQCESD